MPRKLALFVASCSLGAACFWMSAGSSNALAWWIAGIAMNGAALGLVVSHLRDRRGR